MALLRGVNLGARNKIAMPRLRQLFEELGHEDVATYVQSGNVVFRSSGGRDELRTALEAEIGTRFALEIAVLLRTGKELATVVAGNGFAAGQPDPTKLHVTFLAAPPHRERATALQRQRFDPDELRVARDAVYLHCPFGYGRSKLSNAFFEKELGVVATTRNWRTVTALADLAKA